MSDKPKVIIVGSGGGLGSLAEAIMKRVEEQRTEVEVIQNKLSGLIDEHEYLKLTTPPPIELVDYPDVVLKPDRQKFISKKPVEAIMRKHQRNITKGKRRK